MIAMKPTSSPLLTTLACISLAAGTVHAQQTLKTDTAGNPVTALNLGGGNVIGTLPAARLPSGFGLPVVQTVAQTEGNVTVVAGTNVVVLGGALTGPLNLRLPPSTSYGAARALVIVDPAGYTSVDQPATVEPVTNDTLNGGTSSLLVLAGTGTASLYADGTGHWSVGQSCVRAATSAGLVVTGPAAERQDSTLFAVHDDTGSELFAVRSSGGTVVGDLAVNNTLSSDLEAITSDGAGGFSASSVAAAVSISAPTFYVGNVPATPPAGTACLYFAGDGLVHARTPDGVDHILTWTTPPTAP